MNNVILFRNALKSLRIHKIRSFLTILGIMIGIAAIVVTFSIGRGAEEQVKKQILAMGENATYFIAGNISARGGISTTLLNPPRLKYRDLEAVAKQVDEVMDTSHGHVTGEMVSYGPASNTIQVFGQDASILKINKNKIKEGVFFNDYQTKQRDNVVVLGSEIAKQLFVNESPLDKVIKIRNIPFTVIGVMETIEYFWGTLDPNLRVYIPYTVAKKHFRLANAADDDITSIAIRTSENAPPGLALRKMKRVLRTMHNLDPKEPDDFTVFDQQTIAQSAGAASSAIKFFGLIAALISLIVGGIGVMNIMLVSVKERTREIGVRLAIGATQLDIQLQFLFEGLTLCIIGGIIGIFAGLATLYLVTHFTTITPIVEPQPIVVAFIVTVITGLFFCYYPARKASLLNPVDALLNK